MRRTTHSVFLSLLLLAACGSVTGTPTTVDRVDEGEFLKLRAGPGLGFRVILGLPDGTQLRQKDCVTELGQLWCRVALADAPGVTGYVAADYLSGR
ncbi:Bacterial SH3 domain protein [Marinovum algicola DG 898]|nr:Bacterial SH3 domain protein [Marinovum algicola DG 898]